MARNTQSCQSNGIPDVFRCRTDMPSALTGLPGLSVELPDEDERSMASLRRATSAPTLRSSVQPRNLPEAPKSCRSRSIGELPTIVHIPSVMRIRSETMPDDDLNDTPRTPLHKVVDAFPRPINISFDRVELPVSPLLSPNSLLSPRRRLSVTYVRRSRFAATRTEVSIDVGPVQLFMLLCFLATCSAFGVAVPGFGFFHRPAGAAVRAAN